MPIFSQFGEIVWQRLLDIARILQTTALNCSCIDIPKDFLAAEELFPSGSYPKTRLRCGEKMAKNGLKRHKKSRGMLGPALFPPQTIPLGLARFVFFSLI